MTGKGTPKPSTQALDLMAESWTEEEIEQLRGSFRRKRQKGRFLRGPFPWPQFRMASRLPGRAAIVWLLIHHQTRMTRKPEVTLPKGLLMDCGINRDTNQRALAALEHIGLISVIRSKGRSVRVSLIELPDIGMEDM